MYAYIHVCMCDVCCVCLSWPCGREPGRQTDRTENRTDGKENRYIYILSLIAWHGKPNATTVVVRLQYYCSTVVYVVVLYPYPCTPTPTPMPYAYVSCMCCVVVLLLCWLAELTARRPEGRSLEGKGRSPTEGRREEKRKRKKIFFIFFFLCVVCRSSVAHISLGLGGFGGVWRGARASSL